MLASFPLYSVVYQFPIQGSKALLVAFVEDESDADYLYHR